MVPKGSSPETYDPTPQQLVNLDKSTEMCIRDSLTTYCAKGVVRRMLQTAGFTVERLPGPPGGKREIPVF